MGDGQIRIMTFNIWVDGRMGGQPLSQTAEVIRRTAPDIVGMQEVVQNTEELASMLGWRSRQLGRDTAILTRFEILDPTPNGTGAGVRLEDGRLIHMCNVHLAHAPYQPFQLLGIPYNDAPFLSTEEEAIAAADAAREGQIAAILEDIAEVPAVMPLFVTGDFNEPSGLDWTERAAAAGRHPIKVDYPSTRRLAQAGIVDTYRHLHRDEMAMPGYTWPTEEAAQERDRPDRIDFVLFRGEGVRPQRVEIVGGEPGSADIVVSPYPSDHRAVVATFALDNPPG